MASHKDLPKFMQDKLQNVAVAYQDKQHQQQIELLKTKYAMKVLYYDVNDDEFENKHKPELTVQNLPKNTTFDKFKDHMAKQIISNGIQNEQRRAFKLFDTKNQDRIDLEDLKAVSQKLQLKKSDADLKKMLSLNGNTKGHLTFDDFVKIMKDAKYF